MNKKNVLADPEVICLRPRTWRLNLLLIYRCQAKAKGQLEDGVDIPPRPN